MALYEFDENNIVKSSAVDKNGYYRDGGCVFVEDVFVMNGQGPETYSPGNSFMVGVILNPVNHKNVLSRRYMLDNYYLYIGDEIDNADFELVLNNSLTEISNYQDFGLLKASSKKTVQMYKQWQAISLPFLNGLLPENWDKMKAHIIVAWHGIDLYNQPIEGDYGCFQIHQK